MQSRVQHAPVADGAFPQPTAPRVAARRPGQAAPPPDEQQDGRLQQQQQREAQAEEEQRLHIATMKAAFQRSQAIAYAQWDLWAGISLSLLLMLSLPSGVQRQHWHVQLGAFLAEAALRILPAWLATLCWPWYIPRRTPIVAACRLASVVLPRLVLPPAAPAGGWGGWPQFLLFTRALGVNTLPWLARLPFKWFAWVHLIGLADAVRTSVGVCAAPAFAGAMAQRQYAAVSRIARFLSAFTPVPDLQGSAAQPSCLEAVDTAAGGMLPSALGTCACRQMALWLLCSLGYAFPLGCQYLAEVASRQAFYRRHCRRAGCDSCAVSKGVDLPVLGASAALMLAGFSAATWQLSASLFAMRGADLAGATGAVMAGACSLPGECAGSGL